MGAIAGIIYPEVFPVTYAVKPALDALVSRDPGAAQTHLHKNFELGCRGLNLAFTTRRNLCAVVDADLTNESELITALRHAGVVLDQPTTAEIIVHAYEVWKVECFAKFKGAFALAICDLDRHELILARDRIGLRPLYWTFYNNYFLFASELKALLATGLIPQAPSPEGIAAYLYLGYVPQDLSPVEHTNKLLPSYYLRTGHDTPLGVLPYWSYSSCFCESDQVDPTIVAQTLDGKLTKSLTHTANQNLGCLGTSTVGSAYLNSQLAQRYPDKTTSFSVEYAIENEADIQIATQVAQTVGCRHEISTQQPRNMLRNLPRMVWHLDEPIASLTTSGLHSLYQLAAQHTHTMFVDVGTEAIIGAHRPTKEIPPSTRTNLSTWFRWLSRGVYPFAPNWVYQRLYQKNLDPWLSAYLEGRELFPRQQINIISPIVARIFNPDVFLQRFYQLLHLGTGASAQLYLDVKTVLCDRDILMHDRLSAAGGVRWRSPFLDDDVVEYMASVPESIKISPNGEHNPLQLLVRPRFPDLSFARPTIKEQHFLDPWLQDGGIRRVAEILLDGSLVESGWISRRWLRKAIERKTKPLITFGQLWAIFTLEMWFQLFINRPIQATPPDTTPMDLLRG